MKKKGLLIAFAIIIVAGFVVFINPNQLFTKVILKLTGNYAAPDYVTTASILQSVKDKGLNYDRLYRLRGYKAFQDFVEMKILHVPFVQIYNRDKKMLALASGNECKWALMDFFIHKDSLMLIARDSEMYNFVMDRLEPIEIKTTEDTFNYYIIAGWANYVPKLSDDLFKQTNEMKNSPDEKICFSYINFDMQEEWEAEMDSLQGTSKK